MDVDLINVRQALDNDEVFPTFQPLVALHTGRLIGFEVLARWRHPTQGLVLPEKFVSLAEENGLAGQLMHQVVRKALVSIADLPTPPALSINVSPIQLHDATLAHQIFELADKAGFAFMPDH